MNDYKELIELLAHPADGRDNADIMISAADAIEQLVKERDAAVEETKRLGACTTCNKFHDGICTDLFCSMCQRWEWRGVQRANT